MNTLSFEKPVLHGNSVREGVICDLGVSLRSVVEVGSRVEEKPHFCGDVSAIVISIWGVGRG